MASIILYGIPNCDTVKRARAWLDARDVGYDFHDFKRFGVPVDRLGAWCGLRGWAVLLNRAGTTFRRLPDADKADLDEAKAIALMLALPSLIKRPVVEGAPGDGLLIGFDADDWAAALAPQ